MFVLLSELCPGDSDFENERVAARGRRRPIHLFKSERSRSAVEPGVAVGAAAATQLLSASPGPTGHPGNLSPAALAFPVTISPMCPRHPCVLVLQPLEFTDLSLRGPRVPIGSPYTQMV